jgi:hypothetical protein
VSQRKSLFGVISSISSLSTEHPFHLHKIFLFLFFFGPSSLFLSFMLRFLLNFSWSWDSSYLCCSQEIHVFLSKRETEYHTHEYASSMNSNVHFLSPTSPFLQLSYNKSEFISSVLYGYLCWIIIPI